MKPIFTLFSGLLLCLLVGCIGDDLDRCYPGGSLTLHFDYPAFPERISAVEVGIFGADGVSVYHDRLSAYALDRFQGIRTTLPAGAYTAVCWGNALENSRLTGLEVASYLTEGGLCHIHQNSETPLLTHDSLFYGKHTFVIPESLVLEDTVRFIPAHIGLEIVLEGYEDLLNDLAEERPRIEVEGVHCSYTHQMVLQEAPESFFPPLEVSREEVTGTCGLNTLRFETDNEIEIVVYDNPVSNEITRRVPLSPYLYSLGIRIKPGKEYTIRVRIPFGEAVSVEVNEWGTIPTEPEF